MPTEITYSASLAASKGGVSVNTVGTTGAASRTLDMTGANMATLTQALSGTTAAITLPAAVTLPAFLWVANLEVVGGIVVNIDTVTPVVNGFRLRPVQSMLVEVAAGCTVRAIAASGTPTIAYSWVQA